MKETGRLIGRILSFDERDGACEIGYGRIRLKERGFSAIMGAQNRRRSSQ